MKQVSLWDTFDLSSPRSCSFFLENKHKVSMKKPATSTEIDNKTNPTATDIKGDIKILKMDGDFFLTISYHKTASRRTNGEQLLCRSKRENVCTFGRISQCCCAVKLATRSMIQSDRNLSPNRPQSKSKQKYTPEAKSCHIAV